MAICVIGILTGLTASVLWLIVGVIFLSYPFWPLFPIYVGAGAVGVIAAALFVAFRKTRSDDRSSGIGADMHSGAIFEPGEDAAICMVGGSGVEDPRRRMIGSQKMHYEKNVQCAVQNGSNQVETGTQAGRRDSTTNTISLSNVLLDRLFDPVIQFDPGTVAQRDRTIGYFGDNTLENLDAISGWANQSGQTLVTLSPGDADWNVIRSFLEVADLCFVDADSMGDIEDTIDFCLRLRNGAPAVQLILVSSAVRGHDLTAERSAICDATLKPPLTERVINAGVIAATGNFDEKSSVLPHLLQKKVNGRP